MCVDVYWYVLVCMVCGVRTAAGATPSTATNSNVVGLHACGLLCVACNVCRAVCVFVCRMSCVLGVCCSRDCPPHQRHQAGEHAVHLKERLEVVFQWPHPPGRVRAVVDDLVEVDVELVAQNLFVPRVHFNGSKHRLVAPTQEGCQARDAHGSL